jgi:hypothetical protein
MADEAPKSSGFTNRFLPGLVAGLIIGGLAGAFIPSAMESISGPPNPSGGKPTRPGTPNEREGRPGASAPAAPAAQPAAPTDTKPPEPKPAPAPAAAPAPASAPK